LFKIKYGDIGINGIHIFNLYIFLNEYLNFMNINDLNISFINILFERILFVKNDKIIPITNYSLNMINYLGIDDNEIPDLIRYFEHMLKNDYKLEDNIFYISFENPNFNIILRYVLYIINKNTNIKNNNIFQNGGNLELDKLLKNIRENLPYVDIVHDFYSSFQNNEKELIKILSNTTTNKNKKLNELIFNNKESIKRVLIILKNIVDMNTLLKIGNINIYSSNIEQVILDFILKNIGDNKNRIKIKSITDIKTITDFYSILSNIENIFIINDSNGISHVCGFIKSLNIENREEIKNKLKLYISCT
jgi:hypothetical protein